MALFKSLSSLCRIIPNLYISNQKNVVFNLLKVQHFTNNFHGFKTISASKGLMEFFDDEKNWKETDIRVGRAWKKDELRIKSNTDLHKLWYILLKERNMLLTMEYECEKEVRLFPNPERIDKVKESMENLEGVVRERNRSYHFLETGTSGERPTKVRSNVFGLRNLYKTSEHVIPIWMNKKWSESHLKTYGGYAVRNFLKLYREKLFLQKRRLRSRNSNHVMQLLKRFPDMDVQKLKEQYPDVDLQKAKNQRKARGHFVKE